MITVWSLFDDEMRAVMVMTNYIKCSSHRKNLLITPANIHCMMHDLHSIFQLQHEKPSHTSWLKTFFQSYGLVHSTITNPGRLIAPSFITNQPTNQPTNQRVPHQATHQRLEGPPRLRWFRRSALHHSHPEVVAKLTRNPAGFNMFFAIQQFTVPGDIPFIPDKSKSWIWKKRLCPQSKGN